MMIAAKVQPAETHLTYKLMYFINMCSQQMINRQNTSSVIMSVCSYRLLVANKETTAEADLVYLCQLVHMGNQQRYNQQKNT